MSHDHDGYYGYLISSIIIVVLYLRYYISRTMSHLCIATEEGLCGRNVLHSLRVHSCALMLNNICSESMSAARMSLYSISK